MKRRGFLAGSLSAGVLAACGQAAKPPLPPGAMTGANVALSHRLRQNDFPTPSETKRTEIVIVGGGIGGLSAAWKLARSGCTDFMLLELEAEPGGNSRSGHNEISAYPLGAHYLPLPPREASAVRELLAELGVLQGDPDAPQPLYDEKYLCHAPQERLYLNGYWQDGLWPTHGVPQLERDQYARFQEQMALLRQRRDALGRRAFAVPMTYSSRAPKLHALDRIDLHTWLRQQGYTAPGLFWLTDYACRDDYGTRATQTSAWAGLHYFACREGEGRVLTAPEGNAWLARGLARTSAKQTLSSALAYRIEERKQDVVCDVFLADENRSIRVIARQAIWAAPLFVLKRTLVNLPSAWHATLQTLDYAPWVVVNLSLSQAPQNRAGSPLAWDNVLHDSGALGYVVAPHQMLRYAPGPTTITWYRALDDAHNLTPERRRQFLAQDREFWAEAALTDLSQAHPEIRELALRVDVQRYGHAMLRPLPGQLGQVAQAGFEQGSKRLRFAHADVSGFSLFEEANYRGVKAAQDTLRSLGLAYSRSV